jgi:hypothetical protein
VTAGLVVEVEDRGLGMSRADQQRVNVLLADPQRIDVGALLRDGRLGLYVVSVIARRHGIAVQLQTNIFGGMQAIVIVPHGLLGLQPEHHEPRLVMQAQQPPPNLARRQPVAALATHVPTAIPASPPTPVAPLPKVSMSTNGYESRQEATPGEPEPAHGGLTAGITPAANRTASPAPPDRAGRPPLPQRTSQAHLPAESQQPVPPPRDELAGEHNPQLMAAFMQGFRQAEVGTDPDDATQNPTDRTT